MTDPTQPPADVPEGSSSDPAHRQPGAVPQQPHGQQPGAVPQQQPYASAPAAPLDAAQDKMWAAYSHLGGILWLLPALIIWLVFKDRGRLTGEEAKEALNWQITWISVWIASQIAGLILAFTGFGFLLFGLLIPWALYILNLVFSVLGFVQVNNTGNGYRYPVSFRFIR